MNVLAIGPVPTLPTPPIPLLRALPAGPLARRHERIECERRVTAALAGLDREDIEVAVELLLAEVGARA